MRYGYALGLASFMIVSCAHLGWAQGPLDSKLQASTYKAKLVQALDECTSPTTNIGGVDACAPAHVNTDGVHNTFSAGSIAVKSVPISSQVLTILKSSGNGDVKSDLGGKTVRTRLVVRVTKASPSPANTWIDQVLDCGVVTVSGTGNYVKKEMLTDCGLPIALAQPAYSKEIVSGKALAVPGVRKKP